MIAKYDIDPDGFFFDDTLDATATAVALLPAEVNGKKIEHITFRFFHIYITRTISRAIYQCADGISA